MAKRIRQATSSLGKYKPRVKGPEADPLGPNPAEQLPTGEAEAPEMPNAQLTARMPPMMRERSVMHKQIGPNTHISHVNDVFQPHGSKTPMRRSRVIVRHRAGPGTLHVRTREITRPHNPAPVRTATPNPNTNLRYSGNPSAFKFGRKPPI